ncbi:MAG: replication-associated recombination protein A [Burkholderiales bacterium]
MRPDLPLAEQLRPQSIHDVVGQAHLLGDGRPLQAAVASRRLHSMILWGPPGVGKTTLARLLALACGAELMAISAVLGGVKEIREAVEFAKKAKELERPCVVFVDEVHRFNKAQQDAFLPHVEQGLFVFIGATTENPGFEVNSALLSRASVYVLKPLDDAAMQEIIERAVVLYGASPLLIETVAKQRLMAYADGDARRLLGALELCVPRALQATQPIDDALLDQMLPQLMRQFDKGGDAFYDQISALHKSVRGSDPDAALYWFARMVDGGCDPRYIARRAIRMAIEDIGLADPRALTMALEAAQTYERLGSPEGELAVAQALVFMACAAKSNAVYVGYKAALEFVRDRGSAPVPDHLRNAPTSLAKSMGHGKAYRYSQDEPDGFSAGQRYFPEQIKNPPEFYRPVDRGMESKISEKLAVLRSRNQKS